MITFTIKIFLRSKKITMIEIIMDEKVVTFSIGIDTE
jgi:hypothetical protein